jgi:chromosome segregation ATPase
MASLDSATEQIKQLTLDIGVAEEMRNASLKSASTESQEYARLCGRLTELEGQLTMSHQETDDLAVKLESTTNSLLEANEKFNLSESKLRDLDNALASSRSEFAGLEAAMATASATSLKNITELEVKLETVTREGDEQATILRAEVNALVGDRDHAQGQVFALESRITVYETEKEERERKFSELEATSSVLSQRVSDLEAELSSSKTHYDELLSTSTSNEAAANAKMAALQEQAAEAAHAAKTRMTELDAEIIVIRERCTHHIAALTEAKASMKELETTKATLSKANERVTELEDQLLEAEGRAGGFDAQLSEAQEKIQEYEKRQLSHSEAIELLRKEHASALAEYEGRLSEMTSGATANASRYATLENEVAALTARLSSLDSDYAAAKTENDTLRINFQQQSKSAEDSHSSALTSAELRSKELEEQLNAAEEARKLLEKRLADAEQSTSTTQSQSTELYAHLETSLQEAEVKLSLLQSDLDEKNALLEQLEHRVVTVTDLETQLEALKREHKTSAAKADSERDELRASLNVQVSDTQQRETEASLT